MKLAAFISVFLFLFLSIQPMFIKWSNAAPSETAAKTSCCKKSAGKKCPLKNSGDQQPADPCNSCNPFMPCNACPYMPEERDDLFSPIILVRHENTNRWNEFVLSSYHADCWHPPESFHIL